MPNNEIDYSVLYLPVGGGLVAIMLGVILNMWLSRRAFYRRNAAGVEEFASYSAMLGNKFIEGPVKLIAGLLVMGGIGSIVIGVFSN